MISEDEFRIKALITLRDVAQGRRIPILDIVSTKKQLELLRAMKAEGWVGTVQRQVWITREGRRALRCFERLYR